MKAYNKQKRNTHYIYVNELLTRVNKGLIITWENSSPGSGPAVDVLKQEYNNSNFNTWPV